MVLEAQTEAEEHVEFILKKAKLFDRFASGYNERQLRVLRRMLEDGPKGSKGGMSAKRYMSMTMAAKATATRDFKILLVAEFFWLLGEAGAPDMKLIWVPDPFSQKQAAAATKTHSPSLYGVFHDKLKELEFNPR